jgi:hypothetical protein
LHAVFLRREKFLPPRRKEIPETMTICEKNSYRLCGFFLCALASPMFEKRTKMRFLLEAKYQ